MADTLRDLVVNLSLESDNFTKNIKSISAQIREAESEFKAAGAGVDNFEGSLDGVQAKAQMLQKKMELQAKAVQQYEKALSAASSKLQASYTKHEQIGKALDEAKAKYAELAAAYGENSDEAKAQAMEVKKLEAQLASANRTMQTAADGVTKATTNLNNAKKALSDTEKELARANSEAEKQASAWTKAGKALEDFSKSAGKLGKNVTNAGKSLSVGLTAPIVALGTASVAAFNEVDGGLDTIITKTGATGRQLESLTTSYENVFGSLPVTAEEAGIAIGEVNTRFGVTEKTLEDVSKQFLRFSKINGVDLNSSIDGVDKLMTKFGVDASQVSDVLGYMTKVGQDTGLSMSTIISSLQSNGEALKDIGLDLGSSITLLAQFEASGIDAGTALTAMKKAVQSAAAGGKDASKAFSETVAAIKAAKTETEALTIATKLFGARGAAEMVAAIREGRMDVDQLGATMGKYADIVEKTFEATQDLPDETTKAMNRLKLAGNELGKSLMAQVVPAVTTLVEGAGSLVDRLKSMDDSTKASLVRTAAIAAAVGPVVSIAGKMISSIGTITGLLGKFSTAVGAAGGGLKGLGAVLASSPALWLALGAAVAYGTYKLIDYATGAKAVREALEGMNKAAQDWQNNDANTMYSYAKGLSAFGMSAADFSTRAGDGFKWLKSLTTEWADELSETDETVETYIGSFKDLTKSTREGLKKIAQQAADAGYDEMSAQLQTGLKELDAMDNRVSELLKKRKESFLTADDLKELNDIIEKRHDIEVRYKLVDDTSGFDSIQTKVNAALEKAKATGADTGEIYKDALVASAQGMAAVNKQLSDEYDTRYQLIQMMDEQTQAAEKQQRLEELNAWYTEQRAEAGQKYAKLMGEYMQNVLTPDKVKETNTQMAQLFTLLTKYNPNDANSTKALADFTAQLDESTITEYYAQLTQLQSLMDQGLDADAIKELTGFDVGSLEDAFNRLEQIKGALDSLDTDANLDALRSMFGKSLGEEVLKIATDLDMTGAQARWKEFANNPGSKVFTDAIVNSYAEKEGGADTSALKPKVTGHMTVVEPEKENYKITGITIDAGAGTMTMVTDNGSTYTVDKAKISAGTGIMQAVGPNGETYTVDGAIIDAGNGVMSVVTTGGKRYKVVGASIDAGNGTMSFVTDNGTTYIVSDASIDAGTGVMNAVSHNGTVYTVTGAQIIAGQGTMSVVVPKTDTYTVDGAKINAGPGQMSMVTPDGKYKVTGAVIDAGGGKMSFVTENGSTYTVDNAKIMAGTGTMTAVKPNGDTYTVEGATILAGGGVMTLVKSNGSTYTVEKASIDAGTGVMTVVTDNGETYTITDAAIDAGPGVMSSVIPKKEQYTVTGAIIDAGKGTMSLVTGNGETYTVNDATISAGTGKMTAVEPVTGKTYEVEGAVIKAGNGVMQVVLPKGGTYTVKDASIDAGSGEMSFVTENGTVYKVKDAKIDAGPGTMSGVKTDGTVYTVQGASVSVDATVTLSDLSAETVKRWQAVNGPKVNLVADTSVSLGLKFGPGWEKDAKDLIDANMLKLYTSDGIQIPVTPEAVKQLSPSAIVAGVDEDGTFHVIVSPKWDTMTTEETAQGVGDLTGKLKEMADELITINSYNLVKNNAGFLGTTSGWVLEGLYNLFGGGDMDFTIEKAQEYADTIAALSQAASKGTGVNGAADMLRNLASAVSTFEREDINDSFINELVTTLNEAGANVTGSGLAQYLKDLSAAFSAMEAPSDEIVGDYIEQLNWITDKDGMLKALPKMGEVAKQLLTFQTNGGELSDFQQGFLTMFANAVDTFDLEDEAAGLGLQVDSGMAAGIASGSSQVVNAVVKLAQDAITAAKETLDIHSPSRVFRNEVGAMVMKGFGQGIVDQTETQARIIRNAARYLTGEAQTAIAGVGGGGTSNTYNNSPVSINFAGAMFQLQDRQDVKTLAQEIASLTKRQQRGGGLRR